MRIIWRLFGFLIFVLGVAVASLLFLPAERLGRIASDQLSEQLGREVSLGDVRLSFWPVLGVTAGNVRIANAAWSDKGPMMQAERAEIGIDALSALRGALRFRTISADAPSILLEKRADGAANWELARSEGGDGQAALPIFTLDRLAVTGGLLRYEAAGAAAVVLTDMDLSLAWPDRDGPADISATLSPAGVPVSIDAELDKPRVVMAGGAAPVDLSLSTRGGTVRFQGAAGLAPEAQGALRVDLTDSSAFLAAMGQLGVVLPEGLGRSVSGSGEVTLVRDGTLSLRNGDFTMDRNRLSVNADVFPEAVPRVNAQIESEALDLSSLAGSEGESGAGWPETPIDASTLGAVNGEVSLRLGALDLGGFSFGQTRALMTLDQSRAVFEIRELQGYQGVTTGEFVINNRAGLSVGGTLAVAGVELRDLLEDAAGVDRFSGKADGSVRFLGSGQNVKAIVSSLSGDGVVKAGPGVISGIDLDRLFREGGVEGGTTVFDALSGTFSMNNGRLRSDDMKMSLPVLAASGEGWVDLGERSIDYLLRVYSAAARGGRGLTVPVRVKGPWSGPTISADLDEAINANFAEEKQELEQKARERVTETLQKELGVTVEDGQSVEEAIKERARDEAVRGILRLLER